MPDGDFRTRLTTSTAVAVVEAIMRPAVILTEGFVTVMLRAANGAAIALSAIPRLLRALAKPFLFTVLTVLLLTVGAAGGYVACAYQMLREQHGPQASQPVDEAPPPAMAPPQADASPPSFGPQVPKPPQDPFGLRGAP